MAKKSKESNGRVQENTTPIPTTSNTPDGSTLEFSQSLDISKIVEDSKKTLSEEPTKRKRRTKAEMEAASGGRVGSNPVSGGSFGLTNPSRDRSQELKPAFQLYSKLFLADPVGIPRLALDDQEAESLARVTSDMMNAFPEYFNSSNPKIAAALNVALIALPIGYVKYTIYQDHIKNQRRTVVKESREYVAENKPEETIVRKKDDNILEKIAMGGL